VSTTSDYLNLADQRLDLVRRSLGTARRSARPEQVSADIAFAQVTATQALAAAVDRLAAATESTSRSTPGGEHGIQVRQPDDDAPFTIVASGSLDEVRAAVAQFSQKFARGDSAVVEAVSPDRSAYN
jgi:hypothetical protein